MLIYLYQHPPPRPTLIISPKNFLYAEAPVEVTKGKASEPSLTANTNNFTQKLFIRRTSKTFYAQSMYKIFRLDAPNPTCYNCQTAQIF